MGRLIDLDALVPQDVRFAFRGEEYPIPGDIPVENMLRLIRVVSSLEEKAEDAGLDAETAFEQDAERLLELRDELLTLFRIRQPDLAALPFTGGAALRVVVRELMLIMGVVTEAEADEAEEGGDPPPPTSERSTGSRRSRSSSGGRRTTGAASAGSK